jgi:hypothetical protein
MCGEVAMVISSATGLVNSCAHTFVTVSRELRLRQAAESRARNISLTRSSTSAWCRVVIVQ